MDDAYVEMDVYRKALTFIIEEAARARLLNYADDEARLAIADESLTMIRLIAANAINYGKKLDRKAE